MMLSWRFDQREMASAIISSPRSLRYHNGGMCYVFQIGQLILYYFVSKHDKPVWLQDAAINAEGKMRIVHLTPENGSELMELFFGKTMVEALKISAQNRDEMKTTN